MRYEIREVSESEIPECAGLVRAAFADVAARFGLTVENCPANAAFLRDADLEKDRRAGVGMFSLYDSGARAGFVALRRKHAEVFYLEKLAVLPEYRRSGHGGRLALAAERRAVELGGRLLSIGIINANFALKEWYVKRGFIANELREFAHLPFTVCILEKRPF